NENCTFVKSERTNMISENQKAKDTITSEFYCRATIHNAWDKDTLEVQIDNKYYLISGNLTHNFSNTLPAKQSELATQTLKDPYNFAFLGLECDALEKAIEDELTWNIPYVISTNQWA
ncbi:hypothetical protein LJC68_07745, partial [Bacteroidales bacterium OttesenSCG-928-B11]|nr:hypothetical protein [Bacteroidales bacterium OttesenSCG-928-B11]MDL2326687.1 hypothetical protein [Bacteroidales bacterium OttesenSCG-928-A14]